MNICWINKWQQKLRKCCQELNAVSGIPVHVLTALWPSHKTTLTVIQRWEMGMSDHMLEVGISRAELHSCQLWIPGWSYIENPYPWSRQTRIMYCYFLISHFQAVIPVAWSLWISEPLHSFHTTRVSSNCVFNVTGTSCGPGHWKELHEMQIFKLKPFKIKKQKKN